MKIPYNPLTGTIPVEFNEKYHKYSAENHPDIPSFSRIKNKVSKEDFTWYRKRLGVENFHKVKNNISKYMDISDKTLVESITGEIIGDYEMYNTMDIGTQTHLRCEEFIRDLPFSPIDGLAITHFNNIRPFLGEISEIYAIEQPLTNESYSYAGKPDLICKYRGKVTLLDFKTKKSVRKRDWIEGHFIQEGAYSKLWHDNNGPKIEQLVLLVSSRDNQSIAMEFIEEDIAPWIKKWNKILDEFLKC